MCIFLILNVRVYVCVFSRCFFFRWLTMCIDASKKEKEQEKTNINMNIFIYLSVLFRTQTADKEKREREYCLFFIVDNGYRGYCWQCF